MNYSRTHNFGLLVLNGLAHVYLLGHPFNFRSEHRFPCRLVAIVHLSPHPLSENTVDEGFKHTCSVIEYIYIELPKKIYS